jgi:hypothetical protein
LCNLKNCIAQVPFLNHFACQKSDHAIFYKQTLGEPVLLCALPFLFRHSQCQTSQSLSSFSPCLLCDSVLFNLVQARDSLCVRLATSTLWDVASLHSLSAFHDSSSILCILPCKLVKSNDRVFCQICWALMPSSSVSPKAQSGLSSHVKMGNACSSVPISFLHLLLVVFCATSNKMLSCSLCLWFVLDLATGWWFSIQCRWPFHSPV